MHIITLKVQHSKIALLVFIRDTNEEISSKPIFQGNYGKSKQLYSFLNKRIISVARSTGLDYFVITSGDQRGENFAERFRNAFQFIFEKGYEAVISMGNDVPELNKNTLLDVADSIQSCDVVAGRTNLNGVYTLGLTKNSFLSVDFNDVSWCSGNVVESLIQHCNRKGLQIFSLRSVFHEINSRADLKIFIQRVQRKVLNFHAILFLIRLLYGHQIFIHRKHLLCSYFSISSFTIRGSPSFLFTSSR